MNVSAASTRRTGLPSGPALVTPRRIAEPRLRLACLPFAGGGTAPYRPWAARFAPDVEVSAVQLPGREQRFREPLLRTLGAMVEETVAALLPLSDRPLVLFGHSMGAIIAYETARRLERHHGVVPAGMVVSGRAAPDRPRRDGFQAHQLPEADFVEHLRALNGTPAEVLADPELMQLVLPIVRADFEAIETYRPFEGDRRVACPVLALGGDRDPDVDHDGVDGWAAFSAGDFEAEVFAGDHFFLMADEAAVTARIGRWLDGLDGSARARKDEAGQKEARS